MISYWRANFDPTVETPLGVLIELGGDDEAAPKRLDDVAQELAPSGARGARVSLIDPYVGAGGYGLAIVWDVLSKGADILAWVAAVKVAAPHLHEIARRAQERFAIPGSPAYFTPSAIEALYVADLIQRKSELEPHIDGVTTTRLGPYPPEPREELFHMYAAYVVTVTGSMGEGFFARVAVLNSHGILISETATMVPVPNRSHWGDYPMTGRSLYSGPFQTR